MKGKTKTREHKDLQDGHIRIQFEEVIWRGMKKKTKTREHKDLQFGQGSVLVEEAGWNRADVVIAQIPERKEVGMRQIEKKNKNTGTQRLTVGSRQCY
tara:strand:+ start:262 stop:555 length:294 start_codon:yes stop_codon:yes gene_type:complete